MKTNIIIAIAFIAFGLTSCSSIEKNVSETKSQRTPTMPMLSTYSPGKTIIAIPTCSSIMNGYNLKDTLLYRNYFQKKLKLQGVNTIASEKVEWMDCILTTDKGEQYKVAFSLLEVIRKELSEIDNQYDKEVFKRGATIIEKTPTKISKDDVSYGSTKDFFLEYCQSVIVDTVNGNDKRMKEYVLASLKNGISKVDSAYMTKELGNTCVIITDKGEFAVGTTLVREIKYGVGGLKQLNIQDEIKNGAVKIK